MPRPGRNRLAVIAFADGGKVTIEHAMHFDTVSFATTIGGLELTAAELRRMATWLNAEADMRERANVTEVTV